MNLHWLGLNEKDRAAYQTIRAFLDGRLEEKGTVEWALKLTIGDAVQRFAVLDLVNSAVGLKIAEPWRSTWRFIEESWKTPPVNEHNSSEPISLRERVRAGDRSGALVRSIVELVHARIRVEAISKWQQSIRKPPRRPKSVSDIVSTSLTSGPVIDPAALAIQLIEEKIFLITLAQALEAAVNDGLSLAARLGWDGKEQFWLLGQLHRVYYVDATQRKRDEHEPDEFHRGMAPSVKLLYATIERLEILAPEDARQFATRWRHINSPIYVRFWAAISRNPHISDASEVGNFLTELDTDEFWNLHKYPEIAELRAIRFKELSIKAQSRIASRIRRRPPKSQWRGADDPTRVEQGRTYWAVREFRRIRLAGAEIKERDLKWVQARILAFPDLESMRRIDEGFWGTTKAQFVSPNPDGKYEDLAGSERLEALESALRSARQAWDNDPAGRAADWIRQPGNPSKIISDLMMHADASAPYAHVLEQLGWTHSPPKAEDGHQPKNVAFIEAKLVLNVIESLADDSCRIAIDGLTYWLSTWTAEAKALPQFFSAWLRLLPIAAQVTNLRATEIASTPDPVVTSAKSKEEKDLDTLNTPVGRLAGVFLSICPTIEVGKNPFGEESDLRTMRNELIGLSGRAGLIVRHRLIEWLNYFLATDVAWAKRFLISPLTAESDEAVALWQAIARRTQFSDVLSILGESMLYRALDFRLGRETRQSLVFSLVVECLYALRDQRSPTVEFADVQQLIRSLDDEVRVHAANGVQQFVREISKPNSDEVQFDSPESVYRAAAAPFLKNVWPQERSLATPGIARAFADLPATSRDAFVEALHAIQDFMVPFECWSLIEFGLFGEERGRPKLSLINTVAKAEALLQLFNLAIGESEGAVVPHDLSDALETISEVAPQLSESRIYRRLSAAARR